MLLMDDQLHAGEVNEHDSVPMVFPMEPESTQLGC